MSSRSIAELRAHAERLGLNLRVWKLHPWDFPIGQASRSGWYSVPLQFDRNPIKGAVETYLGPTPEAARAALEEMARLEETAE